MSYMSEANAIAATIRGKAKPPGKRAPGPTRRNLQVLGYMRDFFAQNDQLPPMAHIAAHFGWSSDQSALEHVESLMRHGLIERNACGKCRFSRIQKGSAT